MITLQLPFFLWFLLHTQTVLTKNSVIIIGAGPAGVAAAAKLLENSIDDVTILEAENRIGGRIHSVKFGNGYVDVGAQYCHGEEENEVYDLVKDLNVLEHSRLFSPETVKIYTSNGTAVPSDVAIDLYTAVFTYDEDINGTESLSLEEAFLEKYNSTILPKYSHDKRKFKIAIDGIKFIEEQILMNEGAFSWKQIAAGGHHVTSEGDQQMTWKTRGYHMVLDVLMKKYPDPNQKLPIDDKIILNKKVNRITWGEPAVAVRTSDNSTYTADHVIFTPSVGVLQKQKNVLFEPQLPEEKLNALKSIGFNGIMKIILHFPNVWWKETTAFSFVWNKEDLLGIREEFSDGPHKEGISWVAYIPSIVKVASNRNVLIAWASGDLLPEIEKTSDDVIMKGCMYLIRRFLGKDFNITDADKIIKSQWNINPNFLGTYSYENVEYFNEDVSPHGKLGEPLVNKKGVPALLFAGEGTHPTKYATVHGAIASGRREAERIINLHKQ